jgi:hypothetical protein
MVGRVATMALSALLVVGIGGAIAGCSSEPSPSSVAACPLDSITGVLEPLGPPGSIGIAADSLHLIVVWGDGHRSVDVDGTLSVVSPSGHVVARVGDRVTLTGGHVRPGEFLACGPAAPRESGGASSSVRA